MRFITYFKTLAQQETPAERSQRMVPGVVYGLIIATMYALVGSLVNQLSFPDLPVGVDWRSLLMTWLFLAVWLGVGGGFINWFTQTEEGMITSLLVMTLIALGASALTFEGDLPAQFGKVLLLALPVIAVSLLMTITLRWLGVRHADIVEREQTLWTKSIAILVTIALLIGGLIGLGLTRWSEKTWRGVRDVHSRLQTLAADPVQAESFFPLNDVPGLASHLDMPYTVHGKSSGQSVTAAEVTVEFKDGYHITCLLLVFPDTTPFLRACAEGDTVTLPAQ